MANIQTPNKPYGIPANSEHIASTEHAIPISERKPCRGEGLTEWCRRT